MKLTVQYRYRYCLKIILLSENESNADYSINDYVVQASDAANEPLVVNMVIKNRFF